MQLGDRGPVCGSGGGIGSLREVAEGTGVAVVGKRQVRRLRETRGELVDRAGRALPGAGIELEAHRGTAASSARDR
ncbi:hypothetical protein TTY48_39650 [Tsukamurella sp. TY48]|nr:hypothetical protein TTY48_39650 [Tsukamurella sp. TY48]